MIHVALEFIAFFFFRCLPTRAFGSGRASISLRELLASDFAAVLGRPLLLLSVGMKEDAGLDGAFGGIASDGLYEAKMHTFRHKCHNLLHSAFDAVNQGLQVNSRCHTVVRYYLLSVILNHRHWCQTLVRYYLLTSESPDLESISAYIQELKSALDETRDKYVQLENTSDKCYHSL